MPRPRRDSEILPAKERLENAFWELLADREYRKISVTDIVHEAGVNRNSFYYHFSGLPELADAAILHEVEHMPITSISEPTPDNVNLAWQQHMANMHDDPSKRKYLDHLALLAGPHSSPELMESLRDFSRMTLISTLQLDPEHIDLKTDLMLDFTVGGIMSVLRRWPELQQQLVAEPLLSDDIPALATGIYLSMSKKDLLGHWNRIFAQSPLPPDGQ